MKSNKTFCIAIFAGVLMFVFFQVAVDPFFHYHKPLKSLFYPINNQRSQNDGIIKHFDYDALITGTSMSENFKVSEANKIFNANFIKVPFSGGSYKEINNNIETALRYNKKLKLIIRALDCDRFCDDKDRMREDLGEYPTYLYDMNFFNDVKYIFNQGLFLNYTFPIIRDSFKRKMGGTTDFDRYSYWMPYYKFGKNIVLKGRTKYDEANRVAILGKEDRIRLVDNITQNVVSTAKKYPKCTFYYFFAPYSAAWWGQLYENGLIEREIEIEKLVIELILEYDNIKLYSFANEFDIITNLNNYKDTTHYGEKINTFILEYMKQDKGLITRGNYLTYLEEEKEFYLNFDYNSLFNQIDEDDSPCEVQ